MAQQFLFFYLMKRDADDIQEIVPAHIRYWQSNKTANFMGGPFGDRSGGLIVFETESPATAERLVRNDPFVIRQVLEKQWFKTWLPKR